MWTAVIQMAHSSSISKKAVHMAITISLFVVDPELGPRDESEFADIAHLTALLTPDCEAGLEIAAGNSQLIIRDSLDDLIRGVCLGGVQTLLNGGHYRNVSFAGFETSEITTEDGMARFSSGDLSVSAPREEAIDALRWQAERFGHYLQRAFPHATDRAREFLALAKD
jgi:hypothetical protein